jgi:ribosomal protein S18
MQAFRLTRLARRFASEAEKIKGGSTSLSALSAPKPGDLSLPKKSNKTYEEYHAVKSIFFQYKNLADINQTKIDILNKKTLYDGLSSPSGPKSMLSENQKERINKLADERLQELEESGMSREEVIGSQGKGIPLAQDPFFQIVKNDHKARERLFKDNEEYSVKKIVLYALQQNIGYDTSAVGTGKRIKTEDTMFNSNTKGLPINLSKEQDTRDYYVSETSPAISDYDVKDPIEDYEPIIKKEYKRPTKEINIDVNDIHWRNTPLLLQFMTNTGRVKHRLRTGLSKPMHKRIVRVIRHARCMNLIPSGAHVKPYHQIPLRTLHEDLNDEIAYDVDLENGSLMKKRKNKEYNFRRDHFTFTYGFMEPKQAVVPNKSAELIEQARTYAIYLKQQFVNNQPKGTSAVHHNKKVMEGVTDTDIDIVNESEAQKCRPAYEQLRKELQHVPMTHFMDLLFAEHNQDSEVLDQLKAVGESIKNNESAIKAKSYKELLEEVEKVKSWVSKKDSESNGGIFDTKVEKAIAEKLSS